MSAYDHSPQSRQQFWVVTGLWAALGAREGWKLIVLTRRIGKVGTTAPVPCWAATSAEIEG